MCDDCGCGDPKPFKIIPMQGTPAKKFQVAAHAHEHEHVDDEGNRYIHSHHEPHAHGEKHEHGGGHNHLQTLSLHQPLLIKNDRLAERNRGFLNAKGIVAINIVSSPGSGKTTFLAKTLEMLRDEIPAAVIVGDLETANDAARLRDKGAPVVQVTTGTVCHLDAEMISRSLEELDLTDRRLLFIENVGNLVCPSSYDLGEAMRVVLISVTEGEDKPLKYPPIFQGARAVVVTKKDLLEASGIDRESLRRNIHAVSHHAEIIEVSARTGEGMSRWIDLLRESTK
ncbi:MAG: hydrogenase nickel incorporation protein HypB [bacterium]